MYLDPTDEAARAFLARPIDGPSLTASGGSNALLAEGGPVFVGPADEYWHLMMVVRQAGRESFLAFATNEGYLAGVGHRTAGVVDSRLLPAVEVPSSDEPRAAP